MQVSTLRSLRLTRLIKALSPSLFISMSLFYFLYFSLSLPFFLSLFFSPSHPTTSTGCNGKKNLDIKKVFYLFLRLLSATCLAFMQKPVQPVVNSKDYDTKFNASIIISSEVALLPSSRRLWVQLSAEVDFSDSLSIIGSPLLCFFSLLFRNNMTLAVI